MPPGPCEPTVVLARAGDPRLEPSNPLHENQLQGEGATVGEQMSAGNARVVVRLKQHSHRPAFRLGERQSVLYELLSCRSGRPIRRIRHDGVEQCRRSAAVKEIVAFDDISTNGSESMIAQRRNDLSIARGGLPNVLDLKRP